MNIKYYIPVGEAHRKFLFYCRGVSFNTLYASCASLTPTKIMKQMLGYLYTIRHKVWCLDDIHLHADPYAAHIVSVDATRNFLTKV